MRKVIKALYRLLFAAELGDMILGAAYVYTDEMRAGASVPGGPYSVLPPCDTVNLNFNWNSVAGSPFDLSLFVNNVTEEEYYTYATAACGTVESESASPGQPRVRPAHPR